MMYAVHEHISRGSEISEYLREDMEERFQISCRQIQRMMEKNGEEIWAGLKRAIRGVSEKVLFLQNSGEKAPIGYLAFHFLKSGIVMDEVSLCIEAMDDSFYLDRQTVSALYIPDFLQEIYREDIAFLKQKAAHRFIRIQSHELAETKQNWGNFYNAVLFRMTEALAGMIWQEVAESGVRITERFKVLYGGYMDLATVVYGKEYADGILPDGRGARKPYPIRYQ